MVKFSKYVEIGEPVATADAIAASVTKAAEKNDKILAVLEDLGFPGVGWFLKNAPDRVVEGDISDFL